MDFPLTGVEELLYVLDSPAEPQNIRFEIELAGTLDAPRLREAAATVASRHPRTQVRLRRWRHSDRRLAWEQVDAFDDDPVRELRPDSRDALLDGRDEELSRPFDLHRSPPWRIAVLKWEGRTHLLLVVHHALMDGQAAVIMMRELAAAYAGPEPASMRRLAAATEGDARPRRADALVRVAAGGLRRTARVASEGEIPGAPGCHLEGVRLDREQTATLKPSKHGEDAGFTDLLLAAGVIAIDRWNRAHGLVGGRIALLHAVGLPAAADAGPLTNSWMANVIAVDAATRADPDAVLAAVARQRRAQMSRAQAHALGAVLRAPLPIPLWAKRAASGVHPLTGQRLVETAGLTNMGRLEPFDFGGGLQSDACWFDSPVRLPKGLFIGALVHDGALHVGLRSLRAQLGRGALRQLGETYLEVLVGLGAR